jgi:hypothetical protein
MEPINLDSFNETALISRLYSMLRNLPDISNPNFEAKARELTDKNLFKKGLDQTIIQNQFILFAIGEKSVFDQITKL